LGYSTHNNRLKTQRQQKRNKKKQKIGIEFSEPFCACKSIPIKAVRTINTNPVFFYFLFFEEKTKQPFCVLAEFFRAVSWIFSENGRSEKIFPSF
jgi:hypothetical protein